MVKVIEIEEDVFPSPPHADLRYRICLDDLVCPDCRATRTMIVAGHAPICSKVFVKELYGIFGPSNQSEYDLAVAELVAKHMAPPDPLDRPLTRAIMADWSRYPP